MAEQTAEFHDTADVHNSTTWPLSRLSIAARNAFVNRVCTVLAVFLFAVSVLSRSILWFEFVVKDYSNSWLLIFSLVLNSAFAMTGMWYTSRSNVASAGFLALFTFICAYLVNLSVWYFDDFFPMQACYIATAFFTVVTLATFQDKYNFMDINTIIFYDAVTLVLAGLLNYVEPYWSLKSFCIAFALAYGLHAYFAVGIVRATTILGSHAKPSISVAVSAAMLYPFLMVAGLDLKDIAYN